MENLTNGQNGSATTGDDINNIPVLSNENGYLDTASMTQAMLSQPYVTTTTSMMPAPFTTETEATQQQQMSADEIALYDRQIRLWGVQAQEKLRSARILLVGIKALGNEIAKNLVLAGIGTLAVIDHEVVTEDDPSSQFLVSEEHIGQNRAHAASTGLQKLNPRVNLQININDARLMPAEFFSAYDLTVATGLDLDSLNIINSACRISNRKFYAADTHGMYGYIFADLISHDFVVERSKSNIETQINYAETSTRTVISSTTKRDSGKVIELVTKREMYSPLVLANTSPLPSDVTKNRRKRLQVTPLLTCLRALFDYQRISAGVLPSHSRQDLELFTTLAREKHRELLLPDETLTAAFLRSFLQNLGAELSPVAAFLGGSLAQDVINVLGQRENPLQNILLFDGEECKSPIYAMHPIFDPLPENGAASIAEGIPALMTDGLVNGYMGDGVDMGAGSGSGIVD